MALLINNDVTARVLTMADAVGAMYDPPTLALRFKSDILTWTEYEGAVTEEWHNMEPGKYCGFIILIDMSNGEIIGLMNDGVLHHVRVGATAGVGAKYLSRDDSTVLGVVGSGGMAETYAEAICIVRPIEEIRVYSPTPENREAYADLVIGSQQERDRRPGNKEYRRRYETNEHPFLAQVIAGAVPGRESDTETIYFDNNSAGLQFAAVGRVVYEKAKELGLGMHIPMEWFQQDIRN